MPERLVDWNLAERLAIALAGSGPEWDGSAEELRSESDRAAHLVRRYTGLRPKGRLPEAELVDRAEWARVNLESLTGILRQSQVIHTWPAGAMIDFPEVSLMMLCHDDSPNDWGLNTNNGQDNPNQKIIIKDNRLAEAFKVEHFILPPSLNGINNLTTWSIRFPRAQYCPQCGLIQLINRDTGHQLRPGDNKRYDQAIGAFYCNNCFNNQKSIGPRLVPMRFVIATEEGFIDDFPWDWYVHKKKPEERNRGHNLFYKSKGGSASLSDITIESRRINDNSFVAKEDLREIFNQEIFTEICPMHGHYLNYVKGYMPKPWKGWHNNTTFVNELISDIPGSTNIMDGEELSVVAKRKFPRTMQRGAGNIIFPIVYSGILLPQSTYEQQCPPDVQQIIDNYIIVFKDTSPDTYLDYTNEQWREFFIQNINVNPNHGLNRLGYKQSEIIGFIRNHFGENTAEEFINKATLLRRQEFKAFTGNVSNDEIIWYKKSKVAGSEYNAILKEDIFDEVVLLEKLSALKVFRGFTRIKPLMGEELVFADAADGLNVNQLKEFQRVQDARKDPMHTKELPAVEVRGEGIFFKFNNKKLNTWSDSYPDSRLKTINDNLNQANLVFNQNQQLISKRYLFLHTFSHILLKELAEDCGYSLSSLSEIIYSSTDDEVGTNDEMNGILIYTTTSDSEGSLGGLVEKGSSKYLTSVIKKGVDKSRWCSSDPLCITTNQGQGFMGLNLAACYSCVLLPETSCEKMNKYLDRAAVIGTLNNPTIGVF